MAIIKKFEEQWAEFVSILFMRQSIMSLLFGYEK